MKQYSTVERTQMRAIPGAIDTATLELLARWKTEDAIRDPAAIVSAERALAEFKKSMNKSRSASDEPSLFP